MEKNLDAIVDWVSRNHLKLKVKKMQMLLLGRKSRSKELESVRVMMNGEVVIRSQMVKCLGVWIDDRLIWKGHVEASMKRCFSGLARLRRLSGVFFHP